MSVRKLTGPSAPEGSYGVESMRFESNSGSAPVGALTVERLSASEFDTLETAWTTLLEQSAADPLFMSWRWLHGWWSIWGSRAGWSLFLLAAYDTRGSLVGLAPLYRHTVKWNGWIPIRQIQWIGTSWRAGRTVRTEYVDFLTLRGWHTQIAKAFIAYLLADRKWDELVLRDLCTASPTWTLLESRQLVDNACLVRCASSDPGMWVRTQGSYEEYLATLGKHTRLRLHNRRKRLKSMGGLRLEFADENSVSGFLNTLNRLHSLRWGTDCFQGESLEFHKRLARDMATKGQLRASTLRLDGEPVSALYDLVAGDREYNIQIGFDDRLGSGLSLGMLHLGYALERAFDDPVIENYDLLAGPGKTTFYKKHFAGTKNQFVTAQLVRSGHLKLAYAIHDRKTLWKTAKSSLLV